MPGDQGTVREWVQSARRMQENAGKCRGKQGERTGVGEMCRGNAGECQGNVRKWVQSARGMQGNARRTYRIVHKVTGEWRGMQGNARGTKGSGCKVPGECRKMQGNAGECQVNIWEWV